MRHIYHKLVRDRIPALIAASGRQYAVATLDEVAYAAALQATLVEEAAEAAAPDADLATELADVLEVVAALAATAGLDLGIETTPALTSILQRSLPKSYMTYAPR